MRSPSCRRSLDGNLVSEELGFKLYTDTLLSDGAALCPFAREALLLALPMKGALTFASRSTSPWTLPRAAGCLQQIVCLQ